MDDVTTRRALEVVLSRVKIPGSAAPLMQALEAECRKPSPIAPNNAIDRDSMIAAMMLAQDALAGVADFDRRSLLIRINMARSVLGATITAAKCEGYF